MDKMRKLIYSALQELPSPLVRVIEGFYHKLRYSKRRSRAAALIEQCGAMLSKPRFPLILFVAIDCLRRSNCSLYGYERKTTPFMEKLAETSAVFTRAVSTAPWTYPSVISMHTGLYPHSHGGAFSEDMRSFHDGMSPQRVSERLLGLPEIMRECGYRTVLLPGVPMAESALYLWFSKICCADSKPTAEDYVRLFERELSRSSGAPLFIHIQFSDLHQPVHVPEHKRNVFGRIVDLPGLENWGKYADVRDLGSDGFQRFKENRIKLYDASLSYVDEELEKLFQCLEDAGIADASLIIITADHGEAFWEHAEMEREFFFNPRNEFGIGHGHSLFSELIDVPLIIRCPGAIPNGTFSNRVSLVDLTPTVLKLSGVDLSIDLQGLDLFEEALNDRIIVIEDVHQGYDKKAVIKGEYKLIVSESDRIELLFDLKNDPLERNNIASAKPKLTAKLKEYIPFSTLKGKEKVIIDKEFAKRMRDLGYM